MSRALSRRERKKQRVRERLYECALELIERHGYEEATVDAITEAADVAKGTFFNHFQSKDGLLLEYSARLAREHLEDVDAILAARADADDKLERVLTGLARLATREGRRYEEASRALFARPALWDSGCDEPTFDRYARIVRQGIDAGRIRADVDPGSLATLVGDIWQATVLRWVGAGRAFDLTEAVTAKLELVLAGARTARRRP